MEPTKLRFWAPFWYLLLTALALWRLESSDVWAFWVWWVCKVDRPETPSRNPAVPNWSNCLEPGKVSLTFAPEAWQGYDPTLSKVVAWSGKKRGLKARWRPRGLQVRGIDRGLWAAIEWTHMHRRWISMAFEAARKEDFSCESCLLSFRMFPWPFRKYCLEEICHALKRAV